MKIASSKRIRRANVKKYKELQAAHMQKALEKKIEKGNIGYEMIVKMGYQAGQGLGKDGKGILQPLPLDVKTDRKGVGATTSANNVAATTLESRVEHKDIKALQLATITVLGKVNAQKSSSEKQCQPKENKATKDNLKGIEATKLATSTVSTNMQKGLEKKIEKGNIGYEMIVKMGYQAGQGLGKDGKGILQPLPLEVKTDRKGVGAKKSADNVVSAKENAQSSSGKPSQSKENKSNKVDHKEVEVKKTATSAVPAKVNKQSSPSEQQSQPKENKVTKDHRKVTEATKSGNSTVPAKVNLSKTQTQVKENTATKDVIKGIEATKSATSTVTAKVNKQSSPSEQQSQPKENKATKDNLKGIEATKLATSTVSTNMQKGLEKKIEKGNIGYEMIVKMGYQAGQGLGKDGKGILQPLPLEVKTDRKGVGAKKSADNVVSAKENAQSSSGKPSQSKENKSNKVDHKEVEVKKTATSAVPAKVNKQSSPSEQQSQPKENKATKDDCNGIEATKSSTSTVPAKVNEPSPRSKARSRRKANKAAREAAELQARIAKEQEIQKATDNAKELLTKAIEAAKLLKATNNTGIKSADPNAKTRTQSPRRALSPMPGLKSKTSKLSEQKIIQDPQFNDAFLKSLLKRFYSQIQLLQLHLGAIATPDHEREDDLILVKICKRYNKIINAHDLEFLRTELIGWIGNYQEEYKNTPIFHDMTNNEQHITVVCDNEYAYKCLEHCIADIKDNRTNNICILRVPPTTPLIYCFEVIYDGLTHDPDVFLVQLQLHKPKLRTKCWIVASCVVSTYKRKTTMIVLTDERSALALTFLYTSNFYVCLQSVSFRNLGIVAKDYLFDIKVGFNN